MYPEEQHFEPKCQHSCWTCWPITIQFEAFGIGDDYVRH